MGDLLEDDVQRLDRRCGAMIFDNVRVLQTIELGPKFVDNSDLH
jgi:hypothetical protein